jgi:hypothetical protein
MFVLVTLSGSVAALVGAAWELQAASGARAWGNDNQRQASHTVTVHLHHRPPSTWMYASPEEVPWPKIILGCLVRDSRFSLLACTVHMN